MCKRIAVPSQLSVIENKVQNNATRGHYKYTGGTEH